MWDKMAIVGIDDRGRITIPKKIRGEAKKAILLPAGSFAVLIPIREPKTVAEGWLKTDKERNELKRLAEERAKEDAISRARKRKHDN